MKISITLSARLKADLDRYAELHTHTWGDSVDVAMIIPHMLETFIARDRVQKSRRRRRRNGLLRP